MGAWIALLACVSTTLGEATSLVACGDSPGCTELRTQMYANREVWDACDPSQGSTACVAIAGNPKDCTGVLACDFAVTPGHRKDAELATYTIAQQSQGCYQCELPGCIQGDMPYCDPATHRCILIRGLLSPADAGTQAATEPGVTPSADAHSE
jgi:hypothetical protein